MGNLFAGLEKFGLNIGDADADLFADDETEVKKKAESDKPKAKAAPKVNEADFLLDAKAKCPICGNTFRSKRIKSNAKVEGMEQDLKPIYKGFDGSKYGVTLCTRCGYTALDREFKALPKVVEEMIQEKISKNFNASEFNKEMETYDYDMALARYKLCLLNTVVKKAKNSEKAYVCLKTAWILRGKAGALDENDPEYKKKKAALNKEEESFLANALEGFNKAVSTEDFPLCGLGEAQVDYLIAALSYRFGRYDDAFRALTHIITNPNASKPMKERARDLKEDVGKAMKKEKEAEGE